MNRISRHSMFMEMAQAASKRSTCFRRNVGAIITVNNRVVSIGYNGSPAGEPHCIGQNCVPPDQVGCTRAIHAEINALEYLPYEHVWSIKTLYVTESPCIACAAKLIHHTERLNTIYYLNEYRDPAGLKNLIFHKKRVFRITPSGFIIDYATNRLVEE